MDKQQKQEKTERNMEFFILAAILFIGLFLRVSYLSEIIKSPDFTAPMVDAAYNDYWARGLVSGDWPRLESMSAPEIRSTPAFWPRELSRWGWDWSTVYWPIFSAESYSMV
jgi:hypothetical protein